MEKEQTIKPSKNKADVVEKTGKNKKISDFFTTPDKNLEKQKQKSLLQFFSKSASKDQPAVETVQDLVDSNESKVVVGTDGVTTPNNSDKENSESIINIDLVEETDENTSKSTKKQLFNQILGSKDKGKVEKSNKKGSVKELDNTDVKKHKKYKKKPSKAVEDSGNLSDSVVLLSDSSQSSLQHKGVTDTNLTESVALKSRSKDALKSVKLHSDTKVKDNRKKLSYFSADKSECPNIESDKELNKKGQKNCENSDLKEEELAQAEEMDGSTNDGDLPKSKKTALKGKDMLNLLKEIQSTEVVCAKKKKHKKKHKHKHKDKIDVEVHEIAQQDNVTDEDEASEHKDCKNEHEAESSLPNHQIVEEDLKSDALQLLAKKKSTKLSISNDLKTTDNSQGKLKKEKSSVKEKKTDAINTKNKEKSKNLSYDTFTKNFESEKDDSQTSPAKEMSYSDYLKLTKDENLEKESKTENDEEDMECDDIINVIDDDDNDDAENDFLQGNIDDKDEIETDDRNKDNSNFFKVMTSTPAGTKKEGKRSKYHSKADSVEIDVNKKVLDAKENNFMDSEGAVGTTHSVVDKKAKPPNGKGTQATLCFGKTGLVVSKSAVKTNELSEASDADLNKKNVEEGDVSMKTVKRKPGRPRKSRIDTFDLNVTDSSVFATPEIVRKKKVKRRMETSSDMDSESTDSSDRRRSLRKRYKVEAFQMDSDNKTPIKIKLKRCPKSSSSGEDFDRSVIVRKLKTNNKQTAALALLDKAKRGKLKKHKFTNKDNVNDTDKVKKHKLKKKHRKTQNESNSSEDSITRRSSRLEGKVMASMEEVSLENIVISSSDEEGNEHKKVRKRGRPKKFVKKVDGVSDLREKISKKGGKSTDVHTPTKVKLIKNSTPVKNSPKKSGVKLAPMFLKGKSKIAEASPKKAPLDPEQAKQRHQFLMSGVPEALRKQTAVRMASMVDADYPPFPKHNHVVQMPSEHDPIKPGLCDVWHLNCVNLPTRRIDVPQYVYPMSRFTGDLMNSYQSTLNDLKHFKNFSSHEKLTEDIVENCLKEIQSYNPSYHTRTMYKSLLEMKNECEKPTVKSESMLRTDMKGILDGCTDMTVIDIDDDLEKNAKKKKKSLKLQKKEQNEPKLNTEEVLDKPKLAGCGMMWTEKYCPVKTSEVLGNSAVLKKLKTWLTEWKHALDREARKARKLLLKKNKGKLLPSKKDADDLWDDDSDFDINSDDSDDDDSLCNTMLLTGPHGCGKTSSVYALALELGFKVHEVNTSSCRSGKQILSQLQEATQSHQVTTQGSLTPRKNTALADQTKTDNKMPKSFTNLFKKADDNSQDKPDVKDGGKKRKRNKSDKDDNKKNKKKLDCVKPKALQLMIDDSNSQAASNCMNLSSTTLILFDEVDIVFEEDKGFLSAVQNFMSKTKIPILLTSTDPGFTRTFDGRYEVMSLKRPPLANITTHLQIISLVENVRLETDVLLELVQLYKCDVRKCLTMLQFILLSGGGHSQTHKPFQASNVSKTVLDRVGLDAENSQSSFDTLFKPAESDVVGDDNSKDTNHSDDDFVSIKPLKKRRRVIDDDSNSVDTTKFSDLKPNNILTMERNYPDSLSTTVHCVGVETLFRNGNLSVADTLTQGLKSKSSLDLKDMVGTCYCILRTTKSDVFYDNLHLFLPFSYEIVNSVYRVPQVKPSESENKSRRRIKLNSDLYDSEVSNDYSGPNLADTDSGASDIKSQEEKQSKSSREESLCLVQSLSSFSNLYDTFSCLDVLETKYRMKIIDNMQSTTGLDVTGSLVPGVDSQLLQQERFCDTDLEMCETYSGEIKSRSVCKFYREVEASKQTVESLSETNSEFEENFVLPVLKQCEHFSLVDRSRICVSGEYKRACDDVRYNLPLLTHSQQRTRHLDYLPSLRDICRTEQCRQITNTKRRFHHYLDSITLSLKDRTISTLATTLSPV